MTPRDTPAAKPGKGGVNASLESVRSPVAVIFTEQIYTITDFTELMENLEALLILGMAQPYELTSPSARAHLADSVIIRKVSKQSPLQIMMDVQASVPAVSSVVALTASLTGLKSAYISLQLKKVKANAERQREILKQKIVSDLISQYDDLSKKKRKKLLSDKKLMALLGKAAEGAMSIENIFRGTGGTSSPTTNAVPPEPM
jgi:hypothetical protein